MLESDEAAFGNQILRNGQDFQSEMEGRAFPEKQHSLPQPLLYMGSYYLGCHFVSFPS